MADYKDLIKILGEDRVKRNEPMAKHTTFGIGGPTDLFYEAKTREELVGAVKLVRKLKIPYFIVGGGSNLLISHRGIRGMAIEIRNTEYEIRDTKIFADAGVSLRKLAQTAAKKSLSGLEFAVGIPGTVGGAVWGNAGADKEWIGNIVEEVKVLTTKNKIKKLSQTDCRFRYRTSRFKKNKEIILQVVLKLKKDDPEKIREKIGEFLVKRKNQPKEKSAGSIFKNPEDKTAGWLIDQCGLKGKKIGNAQISPKHANFIVNLGKAEADDVVQLIKFAKREVFKKFGIKLEEEISLIGFGKI